MSFCSEYCYSSVWCGQSDCYECISEFFRLHPHFFYAHGCIVEGRYSNGQIILNLPFYSLVLQGTVESRLLTSVFYDFGKSLASSCPYAVDHMLADDFFMTAFREFIDLFPNLRLCDESFASQRIQTGSNKSAWKTYLAFVRLHARNGFKKSYKKDRGKIL